MPRSSPPRATPLPRHASRTRRRRAGATGVAPAVATAATGAAVAETDAATATATATLAAVDERPIAPPAASIEGRRRVVVEGISPAVDGGRFPAKRTLGERVI